MGNTGIPILKDPVAIKEADYLVMESTYGDRLHTDNETKAGKFLDIVLETSRTEDVVIPSFAVMAQEIIYEITELGPIWRQVQKLMDVPVYIDSPLPSMRPKYTEKPGLL